MDLRVQFPDQQAYKNWQEWAAELNQVLSRMITPTPSDQYPIVTLKDIKGQGTIGGASIAGRQVRVLNTEYDPVGACLLFPDNSFTLVKGRYLCRISVPGYAVGLHKARLWNMSDAVIALEGTSEYSPAGGAQTHSWIMGVIEPKSATAYRVEHYTAGVVANGLGIAVAQGLEIYTQVELWGLA